MDSAQDSWRKHGTFKVKRDAHDKAICITFRVKAEEESEVLQSNSAVVLLYMVQVSNRSENGSHGSHASGMSERAK